MSTTALRIIELVKSLPPAEQRTVCAELAKHVKLIQSPKRRQLQILPDGTYYNPEGLSNDDPVFKLLEEIEAERHQTPGRSGLDFD